MKKRRLKGEEEEGIILRTQEEEHEDEDHDEDGVESQDPKSKVFLGLELLLLSFLSSLPFRSPFLFSSLFDCSIKVSLKNSRMFSNILDLNGRSQESFDFFFFFFHLSSFLHLFHLSSFIFSFFSLSSFFFSFFFS